MNRLFPSLAIGIVLAACSGRDVTAPVTAAPVVPAAAARVARVTLSPGTVTLPIGTVQDLFVTLTGADGALLPDRQVTWTTSDESVAIASALVVTGTPSSGRQPVGVASAFHAGTATITGAIDGQPAA